MKQNPIFKAAAAAWAKEPGRKVHISTNDTAKLIRALLKSKFPGVKFSVRSSKYTGGSSIRIAWTDGPTAALVDRQVNAFSGAGFDGMNDMKFYRSAWLYQDGSASFMSTNGTEGSAGVVPAATEDPAKDGAIPVSFSADFIFTERTHSIAARRRTLTAYKAKFHDDLSEAIKRGDVVVKETGYGATFENAHLYESMAPGGHYGGDGALNQMMAGRMLAA